MHRSKLEMDSLPPLLGTNLKHDLEAYKQRATRRDQKNETCFANSSAQKSPSASKSAIRTRIVSEYPRHNLLQPVGAYGKANQVRRDHHEHVADGAPARHHPVGGGVGLPLARGKEVAGANLGQENEHNQPAPDDELHVDV